MNVLILAFLIGIVAGLRALTAPTVVSWALRFKWMVLTSGPLAFLGYTWTPWILTVAALGELVNDKLPGTPSRKVPPQFITRVLMGGVSGGAIGATAGGLIAGACAGAVGAVAGTLGGAEARGRLTRAIGGNDLPIALLEDAVAILLGFFVVHQLA
jgi:uncharacterized membrane protein